MQARRPARETETQGCTLKGGGRGVVEEIPWVSDVICSSCTRQESVICSSKTLSGRTEAGRGRAALWLVSAQQTFLRVNGWHRVGWEIKIIQGDLKQPKNTFTGLGVTCQVSRTSWHMYNALFRPLSSCLAKCWCTPSLTSTPLRDPVSCFRSPSSYWNTL